MTIFGRKLNTFRVESLFVQRLRIRNTDVFKILFEYVTKVRSSPLFDENRFYCRVLPSRLLRETLCGKQRLDDELTVSKCPSESAKTKCTGWKPFRRGRVEGNTLCNPREPPPPPRVHRRISINCRRVCARVFVSKQ